MSISKYPSTVTLPLLKKPYPLIIDFLVKRFEFETILYLSCNPEALSRDLKAFIDEGWIIERIIPFDFFPKTRHVETLVVIGNINNK